MDKLTMAHEWAMKHGSDLTYLTVEEAWKYADAMQAEAEKREPKGFPKAIEQWQPDWSQAPDWADYWCIDAHNRAFWFNWKPYSIGGMWKLSGSKEMKAPTFNYQGDWKDSLRERPSND